jgi:dihydrofolate reductase
MGKIRFGVSVSLDGYLAGPEQSLEHPLGIGGENVHLWMFPLEAWRRAQGEAGGEVNASTRVVEAAFENAGAYLMGRNMFGGGPGPWRDDPPWTGWWGENPPYHAPVYVLTHHPRKPLELQGGTTFHFITEGPEVALERARAAAGDADIVIGGGAQTIQQYLAAGVVDEFLLSISPVLLGSGARLLEHVPDLRVEQIGAIGAPGVTHIRYRVIGAS